MSPRGRLIRLILPVLGLPGLVALGEESPRMELRALAGLYGLSTVWVEPDRIVRLESAEVRMEFELDRRTLLLDGLRLHLGFPVTEQEGVWLLSRSDFTELLQPLLSPHHGAAVPPLRHIVLDPGHGGRDRGAENAALGLAEKTLNLDLAGRVQERLRAHGFTVTLTREADVFVPLDQRPAMAAAAGADLFVSLHFNAATDAAIRGVETHVLTPRFQPSTGQQGPKPEDAQPNTGQSMNALSVLAGFHVQRAMVAALPSPDRGLKRSRFAVLRDLPVPGMLVEAGFLSHPAEAGDVASEAYRDRIAEAVVAGILEYRRVLEAAQPSGR